MTNSDLMMNMSDVKKDLKMFGLKRTGTNWLLQLLGKNYYLNWFINNGGWKHGRYRVKELLGRDMDCIVMVKDLYSWLVSMHRYRGMWGGGDFGEFVKDGQFVEHWNLMNRHWLETSKAFPKPFKMVIVRYEDLLENPEKECGRIASEIGLTKKLKNFVVETHRMGRNGKPEAQHFLRKPYYLRKKYMDGYTTGMINTVKKLADKNLAKELGYVI